LATPPTTPSPPLPLPPPRPPTHLNASVVAVLTHLELATYVRMQISAANDYTRRRKRGFRLRSVTLRVTIVAFSAASTIILGLRRLDPSWTGTAFALVAVVTAVSALEPFFAWRQLWVVMEEASYRFHRLADELEFYVATTAPDELDSQCIRDIFDEYQQIWDKLSTRWLSFRETADR
ncbi:SLATT domain-containing protein, partial [Nocardia sp. NPDC051981]|uniref:SLATT domain-containing protein n=1 Tax=Nocardia sp. NPDC051981 TaxID=3155417 RepID=UPI0034148487